MDSTPPYLTIVVASRNDFHGGSMLHRMRLFVNRLLQQTRQYEFPVELIFVEWNPPADRPPLCEVLPAPAAADYLAIRYIRVPAALHRQYKRSTEVPLFQMIAKNVGVRRAQGTFVLCTNIDLLFSDPLMRALAARTLRPDTYYRANRCDVTDGIDPAWDIAQQLEWCERNVIQRLGRDSRFKNINLELLGMQNGGVPRRWILDKLAIGLNALWSPEKRRFYQLDTFACGDFTLMSRAAWEAIQGYLELDLYSLHVDSLGLIAAASLGYRQHVFPRQACTYHIDHPAGWSALSPLQKVRFLEERPAVDYSLVYEVGLYALKQGKTLDLNPADWGFAEAAFEEVSYAGGRANRRAAVAAAAPRV